LTIFAPNVQKKLTPKVTTGLPKLLLLGLFASACVWLLGCQTAHLPPANLSDPGWNTHHGQAIWRAKKDAPEIAGDLLVATNPDGRATVLFTKTPLPFVVAQSTTNAWQIEFVPVHKKYWAHGTPPARIIWFQLPKCLAGKSPATPWTWHTSGDGWQLVNQKTGESLEGYLNP
jgi:hypothetical protein